MCSAWRRVRFSRYRFTWRSSLSATRSIDAYMSVDDSRARSTGPFVHTVASATCFSVIDGLCSTASSSSHRLSSERCRASLPSLRSEYAKSASVTSTLRPLTCKFIYGSFGRRSPRNILAHRRVHLTPHHPGERDDGHRAGAALAQRGGAGGERRAGGEHVVDDDD